MIFRELSEIRVSEPVPGFRARFLHSESMTVAYWEIEPGASMPEHSHPHEQIVNVIEGEFELSVGGEKRKMSQGLVAVIPPDVPHSGTALIRTRIIDVFFPVRGDYR
jgi:quercetin dioxygenase-like cupin family protein